MTTTPKEIFSRWQSLCQAEPSSWSEIDAAYRWRITGEGGGTWTMSCREEPDVKLGEEGEVDLEATLSVEDFVMLASGELNPQAAFLEGRLQVAGDIGMALRLSALLDKLIEPAQA